MEKIKQNIFWAGIGTTGILLALFFIFFIIPKLSNKSTLNGEIVKKTTALNNIIKSAAIYSEQDIDKQKKKREEYKSDYDKVVNFYAGYDTSLEKWFEGLPEIPPVGLFDSKHKDKREALERSFREKQIWFDSPDEPNKPNAFNWEDIQTNYDITILKKMQKRYWIRERIANVIQQNNPSESVTYELNEIVFFESLIAGGSSPPPKYKYPAISTSGGFKEYQLPDGLGNTITFGISLNTYYNDIPKFINKLLSTTDDIKPTMLINLRGCEIKITQPLEDEKTIEFNDPDPDVKPNLMEVLLVCEVIDFDPTKKQNFSRQE